MRAGVPLTIIAQLTGHKNIGSLLRYTTASNSQQQQMCSILQGKRQSNSDSDGSVPSKILKALPASQSQIPNENELVRPNLTSVLPSAGTSTVSHIPQLNQLSFHNDQSYLPSGLFHGAHIGTIGSIHINITK